MQKTQKDQETIKGYKENIFQRFNLLFLFTFLEFSEKYSIKDLGWEQMTGEIWYFHKPCKRITARQAITGTYYQ